LPGKKSAAAIALKVKWAGKNTPPRYCQLLSVKIGFLYLLVNKYPQVTGNPLKERQIQAPLAAIQPRPFQGRGVLPACGHQWASYHLEVTLPALYRPTGNL
jgi:hypothetical protein